ncbi:MAG: aminotransferase class V-fold PLP-dependent enzyme [Cellvibrionaceae bacterium]
MVSLNQLAASPNILADDYTAAKVCSRIMLTGHIHQPTPDCAKKGYEEHWHALNSYGEERMELVFKKAWEVRAGFADLIDTKPDRLALDVSVHDLVIRFLSALPLRKRPKIVTTDGEHPSVLRQLRRLKLEGIEVVEVSEEPASTVVERVSALVDERTAAVMISSVFADTGHQALELDVLAPVCRAKGAQLFVDAYQSVNVQAFSISDYDLEDAFVVGGGAKYCQLGNGNCFMHIPDTQDWRPVITGWYGIFDPTQKNASREPLLYAGEGEGKPAQRFDGSTYDAMPHFRAAHVFNYFKQNGLTPELLEDNNHRQLYLMANSIEGCDFDPNVICLSTDVEYMGGFISFRTPHARLLSEQLRDVGVHTDYRQGLLRMGPAPYLSDEQLLDGIHALEECVRNLR